MGNMLTTRTDISYYHLLDSRLIEKISLNFRPLFSFLCDNTIYNRIFGFFCKRIFKRADRCDVQQNSLSHSRVLGFVLSAEKVERRNLV
jgi:hypothetical protein